MSGIGAHTHPNAGFSDEWLTPPEILHSLGAFDLDPCTPETMPWETAKQRFTQKDNGLLREWRGRVWLNPPYGAQIGRWLARMAEHRSGIALVFARTETKWFHQHVWPHASALLFLEGRLNFYYATGRRSIRNAGGPSVLIAYSFKDACFLAESGLKGKFLLNTEVRARTSA